jgi:para-nitrobenzyl esterase
MPMYHGAVLARRGEVVVVTINYRLGLFGYLRGIDVCGDALPSTGNEGLLDQLAALRWVKEQIAAFGGDPDNVTVFGQSAGSSSIYAMLSMPRARGLFHKAILQSGMMQVQVPAVANRVMEAILDHIGLEPHEAGRLRDLTAAELLDIQTRATPRAGGSAYRPVADGIDVPIDPYAAIAAGSATGIPLLVGTNLEEWKFFIRLDPEAERLTDDGLLTRLADPRTNAQAADNAQFDPAEAVTMHRQARAARGESTTAWDLWVAIMSDRRFRVPSMRLAERHSTLTPETYAYLFTWKSPGWDGRLGAGHEIQVPFVFGTLDAPDSRDLVPAGTPVGALPELMQDAWVAFARTGSPRTRDLPGWEPYTAARRTT